MGLAHALGKTTIIIKQKDAPPVPFDLRNYRYFEYDTGKLPELKGWLSSAFLSVPQRYSFDRYSPGLRLRQEFPREGRL